MDEEAKILVVGRRLGFEGWGGAVPRLHALNSNAHKYPQGRGLTDDEIDPGFGALLTAGYRALGRPTGSTHETTDGC